MPNKFGAWFGTISSLHTLEAVWVIIIYSAKYLWIENYLIHTVGVPSNLLNITRNSYFSVQQIICIGKDYSGNLFVKLGWKKNCKMAEQLADWD